MNVTDFVDSVGRDLRHALRALLRRPTFTFAAVLTLALGIGATTAIFSVVYSVVIKPLPYPSPDELVRIRHPAPGVDLDDIGSSSNMYLTYRQENRTFASVGLWQDTDATLTERGESQRVHALRVTDGTLQALRVRPILGRSFTEAEHGPAAQGPWPVILSYAFWQRRFGGDKSVLTRELSIEAPAGNGTLRSNGYARVVGILPPDFRFLDKSAPEVILAVRLDPAQQAHGAYQWQMLARLKTGASLAEARADLERMRPIWRDAWPPFPGSTLEDFDRMRISALVRPMLDDLTGGIASMLWVLMAAIGAVLLIACVTIANLMLVRAEARRPEFAVRIALGAMPSSIAKELLAESLCLGAVGGVLGVLLAVAGLRVLVALGPSDLPRLQEIAVSPSVLLFAVGVSLLSALLFGSVTALKHARRVDVLNAGSPRGSSASRERIGTRNVLVAAQVALALVLLVSAALMGRTFQTLRDVDPGFSEPATLQTVKIWVPSTSFPDARQVTRMQREMVDRIAALPGVTAVGFADAVPLEWGGMGMGVAVEGSTQAGGQASLPRIKFVSPGYFEAMGTRLIAGRGITWNDLETGGRVVVISESFARQFGTEPAGALGKRVRFATFAQDSWREVIGVVQNIHENGLYEAPPSMVYWPALAENLFDNPAVGTPSPTFVIRSQRAGTAGLADEVRNAIRSVSASIPIGRERTMQDLYAGSLARTSFTLVMLAIAGGMALLLGVIGIYGVIAYVVSQRTKEIGIRSALGAEPRQLKRMFLLHGLGLGAVGCVVGLVAAMALGRLMSSLLFGVGPLDPIAYIAAVGATIVAAALASYLPARRAAAIDPIETLRAE
jgi:predicted permease